MLTSIVFDGDDSRGITLRIPEDRTLAALRNELSQSAQMHADERFRYGGRSLAIKAEEETLASEIMDDERVIHIQPRPKAVGEQSYTILRASDQKKRRLKLKPDTSLAALRTLLGSWIADTDAFMGEDEGKIEIGEEANWQVADLASANGTVTVGVAKPADTSTPPGDVSPTEPVKPTRPDTTPTTLTWGLTSGGTPEDLLSHLMQTIGDAEVENPTDFEQLSPKQVKAIFTALYLNRGLRFGPLSAKQQWAERSPMAPVVYRLPEDGKMRAASAAVTMDWETTATASRVLHELRERTIHAAHASGGYEGFGIASQFRQELETLNRQEVTAIHLLDQLTVPRIRLFLHPEADLGVSEPLVSAVKKVFADTDRAAQYRALHRDVFDRFGYFFPCEVMLGGKWMRSLQVLSESNEKQQQFLREFNFSAAADVQTSKGRVTADVGYGNRTEEFQNNTHIQQLRKQTIRIIGGSTAKGLAEGGLAAWAGSVARVQFWAVIENRKLRPITQFLPQSLADQCHSLIDQFAESAVTKEYTVLDMRQYVAPANEALLDKLL